MERRLVPELMDDPQLDEASHLAALRGLRRVNAISGVSAMIWGAIKRIAARRRLTHFSVLDVACGGGDLITSLSRRARGSGLDVDCYGCDVSPTAVAHSNRNAGEGAKLSFFVADAISEPLPGRYDFVTSTLFLHHLDQPASLRLLGHLSEAAQQAVLLDDLERSRTGWLLAWAGCRLLSRSPIVHYDGPASVRGAYTVEEAQTLAETAGLASTRWTRHWPCRYLMEWERTL
ncbi:Ubiquinone biosynthesis O-methyltransferase [Botrimarina colliarenosi]|uniref:Ubiquinone biosynthesis O-methyltransferase n=1 Tax=Botrimarina colliarenosi TaxID=2528001 RepID=A0A5C6AF84_9BACT|nr:methyltransferase domain-containing protein [Botrimarina colliarenosi]TWT97978.1 Ubiquinone biosynthesis O-methyltransferase [Botrimarina colliarenosi]